MDFAELFKQTQDAQQQGRIEQAIAGYGRLLEMEPENGQLCYLLALLYVDEDDLAQARHWFAETVRLAPQAAPAHYNLGVIAAEEGHLAVAIGHYEAALALQPGDTDTLFNLALTLKQDGRLAAAEKCYLRLLAIEPQASDTLYNLGVLCKDMARYDQAISYFEETLAVDDNHLAALNNLGYLYHRQQRLAEAITTYEQLIAADYNRSAAEHMLAALTGTNRDTAPSAYVRDVFDQFSDHYEEHLQDKLGYEVPALLRQLTAQEAEGRIFSRGLDMGCGTGLSGLAFRDICPRLIGLDLSPKMLALAADKQLYQQLYEQDIVGYLQQEPDDFDLFIGADVLVYLGDLRPIFDQVSAHARAGAFFLLSTEKWQGPGYTLQGSGRYAHSLAYIKTLAQEYGWQMRAAVKANIRQERGEWLTGYVYALSFGE